MFSFLGFIGSIMWEAIMKVLSGIRVGEKPFSSENSACLK